MGMQYWSNRVTCDALKQHCVGLYASEDPLLHIRKLHVIAAAVIWPCVCVCVGSSWCLALHLCVHVCFFFFNVCVFVRVSPEGKALKQCEPESKQLWAEAGSGPLND